MARRKTLPESLRAKYALAERLSTLRAELFGDRGGPELARRLGLPVRTWYNYESGVTVSAEVILRIIELTSVEPMWLLHGKGPRFRNHSADSRTEPLAGSGVSVGSLLRTALEMLEKGGNSPPTMIVSRGPDGGSADENADVVLLAVDDSTVDGPITRTSGPKYVVARSEWVDAERECRVIRVEGDAMSPILSDSAYVAFSKTEEALADLDGKMVVAWVDSRPVVRWFQFCGRYVVLRAENALAVPAQIPVDLEGPGREARFRRVLWINTPH